MTRNQEIIAKIEINEAADNAKMAEFLEAGFKKAGPNRIHRGNVSISIRPAAYSLYATVKVDGKKLYDAHFNELNVGFFAE